MKKDIEASIEANIEKAFNLAEDAQPSFLDSSPHWRLNKALFFLKWLVSGDLSKKFESMSMEDRLSAHGLLSRKAQEAME